MSAKVKDACARLLAAYAPADGARAPADLASVAAAALCILTVAAGVAAGASFTLAGFLLVSGWIAAGACECGVWGCAHLSACVLPSACILPFRACMHARMLAPQASHREECAATVAASHTASVV